MRLFLLCVFILVIAANGENRVPTLLWGSNEVFGTVAKTGVSYESVKFTDLWNAALESLFLRRRTSDSTTGLFPKVDASPDLFVLFLSKKLTWMQMGQNSPAIKPLHDAFDASDAQFAFTNVMLQEGQHLTELLPASLDAVTAPSYFGSCSQDSDGDLQLAVKSALAQAVNARPRALVVCGSGSLEDEMAQLKQVTSVINADFGSYAVLIVSEPQSTKQYTMDPQKRRALLETEAKLPIEYYHCDGLCVTRVKFLEGMVLAFILALALTAGLCCMHILDSPSQFEKPEEDQ